MRLRVYCEIPDQSGGAAAGLDQETYPFPASSAGQGKGRGRGTWGEKREPRPLVCRSQSPPCLPPAEDGLDSGQIGSHQLWH